MELRSLGGMLNREERFRFDKNFSLLLVYFLVLVVFSWILVEV